MTLFAVDARPRCTSHGDHLSYLDSTVVMNDLAGSFDDGEDDADDGDDDDGGWFDWF